MSEAASAGMNGAGVPAREIRLTIGGLTLSAASLDPSLRLRLDEPLARFAPAGPVPADLALSVAWGDLTDLQSGIPTFDAGPLWQLYGLPDAWSFRFSSPTIGPVPYKVATIARNYTSGEVRLHRPYFERRDAVYPLEYPLDELLVIQLLGAGRGAEIHGCGVVIEGRGYVFSGQSGAGKTTIGRLWRDAGADLISDDRVILRPHASGRGVTMYGTPWHGDEPAASPTSAPLAGVFFLRQERRHGIRSVPAGQAVAQLLAYAFPPFHDAEAMGFTMAFLEVVAGTVPCVELGFIPEPSVTAFVRERLS